MVKITADGRTLWVPGQQDCLTEPELSLAVNKVGSLSFKLYPQHPCYDLLTKMRSVVTVYQDNEVLFKGRVFSDLADFRKVKKVEVEGLLGYLNDSVVRPYSYSGTVAGYVRFLIEQHNAQMPAHKHFKLGRVTVTDPNDYITRSASGYPYTWDEMSDKLVGLLGGYLMIRYESDGNYIDYLADFESVCSQPIRYAVNLLDLSNEVKPGELATCIIPIGAVIESEEEGAEEKRVTIESVNDGLDYICDAAAEEAYGGRIIKAVTWDDVTLPENLLRKAKAYLSSAILLQNTLTVKAVDLHLTDRQIEAFRIGQMIPVYSAPHGIDETMLLSAYSMDLSDPAGASFTLGRTKSSFVDTQFTSNRSVSKAVQLRQSLNMVNLKLTEMQKTVDLKVDTQVDTAYSGMVLGISQDGSVVPVTALDIHGLTAKTSIAETDELPVYGANVRENRRITWKNLRAALQTYFDDLYVGGAYAANESVCGTWFDADLYRKVITIPSEQVTSGTHSIAHEIADLGNVVRMEGILTGESGAVPLIVSVDAENISYTVDSDLTGEYTGYVTIEYTKKEETK